MNNLIQNSKGLGSKKCLAFQKVESLLYKGRRGISIGCFKKVIESQVFLSLSFYR